MSDASGPEAWKTDVDFVAEVIVRRGLGPADDVDQPLGIEPCSPDLGADILAYYDDMLKLEKEVIRQGKTTAAITKRHDKLFTSSSLPFLTKHSLRSIAWRDFQDLAQIDWWATRLVDPNGPLPPLQPVKIEELPSSGWGQRLGQLVRFAGRVWLEGGKGLTYTFKPHYRFQVTDRPNNEN